MSINYAVSMYTGAPLPDGTTVTLTNAAYWLAQDDRLRNAFAPGQFSGTFSDLTALAAQLTAQGLDVDDEIMLNPGTDAVGVMFWRTVDGDATADAWLTGKPIKTSCKLEDYPPFDPPPPVVHPPTATLIGKFEGFGFYTAGALAIVNGVATVADGQKVIENGKMYTAHVSYNASAGMSPGATVFFTIP